MNKEMKLQLNHLKNSTTSKTDVLAEIRRLTNERAKLGGIVSDMKAELQSLANQRSGMVGMTVEGLTELAEKTALLQLKIQQQEENLELLSNAITKERSMYNGFKSDEVETKKVIASMMLDSSKATMDDIFNQLLPIWSLKSMQYSFGLDSPESFARWMQDEFFKRWRTLEVDVQEQHFDAMMKTLK